MKVENQSTADFGNYLDRMLDLQIPKKLAANYGKVVKKLGLYRGPEIEDLKAMAKKVMQSQAAAYYDPASEAFYVVMQDLPGEMQSALYAHELYHGLQDQHFDLTAYMTSQVAELNDDEFLARQAVVEGEATYVMTLWTLKNTLGVIPEASLLEMSIRLQSNLDASIIRNMLKSSATAQTLGADLKEAVRSMDDIPPFMLETMVGAYLKGMGFVFEIQKAGWQQVQELYTRPPVSSEQILHPEKWITNETPIRFDWPAFDDDEYLRDWDLLDSNTLGEIQWRIIFSEHELEKDVAKAAAAGWNGDLYAVLEHREKRDLLLLIYSSWDSVSEAEEFQSAYQQLIRVKYPEGNEATSVERIENEVLIVEGGEVNALAAIMNFARQVQRKEDDLSR